MITHSEEVFMKFVEAGYDLDAIAIEDMHHVVTQWKIHLIPAMPPYSWPSQESRRKQWPWIFANVAERLQADRGKLLEKIEQQKRELIEAKKELSQLKRAKK